MNTLCKLSLSFALVALLGAGAGCARSAPEAVSPAQASHPIVGFAVRGEPAGREAPTPRYETQPVAPSRVVMWGGAR
jgi:hypothetical protein